MAAKKKATTAKAKKISGAASAPKAPAKKKTAKSKEPKTKPTTASVEGFIAKVPNPKRREDAKAALAFMKRVTGLEPIMWGPSIIGFGAYHYEYDSGCAGDMCMTGFSPRSSALVFYLMGGAPETDPLFKKLGKYKVGKSCLYVNKLEDIDMGVLEKLVRQSVAYMKKTYKAA